MFVEWNKARQRHCQLEARIPALALAPGSARPTTGLGKKPGAEPGPGAACERKVSTLDWRLGKAMF